MKTMSAKTAQAIRRELKENFPSVKFTVRSENFSMGDAVRIAWIDGPQTKQVEEITDKYQYGSFNGMEDIYEYSNRRDDIPQAKYIQTSRDYSNETIKHVVDAHNKEWSGDFSVEIETSADGTRSWIMYQYEPDKAHGYRVASDALREVCLV